MIKLRNLIKEHAWDRNFGEPLPTLKDVVEKHQIEEKEIQKLNESPEHQLAGELDKVSNNIFQIMKRYEKKADVGGMVRSWMLGLRSRLKKSGVKI